MSAIPKKLVVEVESCRERACRVTGTKEALRMFGHDLLSALDEIPEQTAVSCLMPLGWEQHTFDAYDEGFSFSVQPDIESYIQNHRSTKTGSSLWFNVAIVTLFTLALIGIRTLWLWIF